MKSTFFVLGQNVSASAGLDLARRARREGHWIGNHTWSHTGRLGEMTREAALEEFDRTQQALDWLEQPVRLFRPRGGGGRLGKGLLNPAIVERLTAGGFTCVLWTSVPGDFRDPDGWLDRALADCRSRDWSLVVLHDIRNGAARHLNSFLGTLAAEGYSFTQEFPPDCTPILNGRVLQPLDQFC